MERNEFLSCLAILAWLARRPSRPMARLSVPVLRYDHNSLLEFESVAVAMVVVVSMISSFDVYVCSPI